MRKLTAATLIALAGFSTVAVAQESATQAHQDSGPSCLCAVATNGQAGGPIARLSDIEGQVLRADSTGYTPVTSEVELIAGDRVVLLGNGKATLTAGAACQASLLPGSTISIDRDGRGAACIYQSVRAESALHVPGAPFEDHEAAVIFAFLAAGGGTAAILLTKGDDDDDGRRGRRDRPVSP